MLDDKHYRNREDFEGTILIAWAELCKNIRQKAEER